MAERYGRRFGQGDLFARERGAIAAAEARIVAIARQPDTEYPDPSGNFRPLHGAAT